MMRTRKRMKHYFVNGVDDRYMPSDNYIITEGYVPSDEVIVSEGDSSSHHKSKKVEAQASSTTNISPEYHGHIYVEDSGEKDKGMNDIAGLMALMQGNKGMDPAALLALCKEKGYDKGFGGEGMFMFVFLILFLFAGGGWNNFGRSGQQAFNDFCASQGVNCQEIIGIHDRISAAQAASTQGFFQLDTKLCSSIAEVLAAVRNQGDRLYDVTRNVGDTVRDCCCKMEAKLASIECGLNGIGRDIKESANLLNAKIELEALKAENARAAMECRLMQQQKDCCCETQAAIADLKATIQTNRLEDENQRLQREVAFYREKQRGDAIVDAVTEANQNFLIKHYRVTNIPTTSTTPAA